ncbi:hypothetical protein N7475_007585 [Penicillium sp. IBT 31633x]|nr:hypothetical protein N7475_007585 [Penicillium sp. IBT 31633x]
MTSQIIFFIAFLFVYPGSASSIRELNHLHQVYQFPNGSWVENIAVRSNGNLLVTLANTPELWQIMPSAQSGTSHASLVHHFDNAELATGVTELSPDVFAVITPNIVWKIDLNNGMQHTPTRIVTLPAGNLNGIDLLNADRATVAISDSQAGLIWYLNTVTGDYNVLLRDETTAANTNAGPLLGANGLKVHDGYVYYTNTPERLFCRIPVDQVTGQTLGPSQIISRGALVDDFAISAHGVGYLAGLRENIITRVFPNGTQEIVVGSQNSTALMSATSAAFGKGAHSDVLYITTGGETDHPMSDMGSRGGKVMALSGIRDVPDAFGVNS